MPTVKIKESSNPDSWLDTENCAIGIDFGTTNSLVAISKRRLPRIIQDQAGRALVPSIITEISGHLVIGDQELATNINGSIRSIKRLLGRSQQEVLNTPALLAIATKHLNLDTNHLALKFESGRSLTVPQIVGEILLYLKMQAELDLQVMVTQAVITVPAHFDDVARGQMMLAAKIAGLRVLRLIAEPTAAAYAYGLHKNNQGCYLVYDLGGGTFDVSILNVQAGVLQVMAIGGESLLGGDDIDQLIHDYWTINQQIMPSKSLLKIAKQAKESLNFHDKFDYLMADNQRVYLDRQTFERLILPLIVSTIEITNETVIQAGSPLISSIILVGGSTRIKLISDLLQQHFSGAVIFTDLDPDKIVALGAALQAENLTSAAPGSLLIDVLPLSLGVELYGGIVEKIILRNSPLPLSITKEFTTYLDNQTAIKFHIVQGERDMAQDCRSLARFELKDLRPLVAGTIRAEVTFSIDVDGILSVSALEKLSGQSHIIEVNPNYGLSQPEITNILKIADQNTNRDHQNKVLQEAITTANSLIYHLENAIIEFPEILTPGETAQTSQTIAALKDLVSTKNLQLIMQQTQTLQKVTAHFVSQKLNRSAAKILTGRHVDQIK